MFNDPHASPPGIRRSESPQGPLGHLRGSGGFTLVELLVVILIIGVLAAIVVPAFLGQKHKALDAQAKVLVRSAQTAAEAIAADNSGGYERVTPAELHSTDSAIRTAASTTEAYISATTHARSEYSITAKAPDGNEFTITRSASGDVTRQCVSTLSRTGCGGGETATW